MQSHKAKLMPNTLHFFYQSKEMYDIDFTKDKAPFSTVRSGGLTNRHYRNVPRTHEGQGPTKMSVDEAFFIFYFRMI